MKLTYKSRFGRDVEEEIDLSQIDIHFQDPGHMGGFRLTVEEFFVHIRDRIIELEAKVEKLENQNEKK